MALFDEQTLKTALQTRIQDVTERYCAAGYFPTASVRVFDKDHTLATYEIGQAKETSVYDVASLTKIATTTQVLQLIDEGKVDLYAPVGRYFEEIEQDDFMRVRLQDVTIYKLLTHTSTIVDWYPFYVQKGQDFFTVFKTALLKCPPSVGMEYSDLNFMLLGKLLERIHGMPLEQCLQENLVKPLGLGTMLYRPEKTMDVIPTGYGNPNEVNMIRNRGLVFDKFRSDNEPVQYGTHDGNAYYYFDDVAGHAGIFAVPSAYEKLCRFYMNTDKQIFIDAQQEKKDAPTRGLGFQVSPMYPHGCGHTGFTGTSIWFSREKNIGAIAFTNRLFYPGYINQNMTADYRRALHEEIYATVDCLRK